MSQLPDPFLMPGAMPPLLRTTSRFGAARRAGALMMLIGVGGILMGVMFYYISSVPVDQMPADQRQQMAQLRAQLPPDANFKLFLQLSAGLVAAGGLVLGTLGLLVWRGNRTAMRVSLFVVGALMVLFVLRGVFSGGANAATLFMAMLLGALCLWQLLWLRWALSEATSLRIPMPQWPNPPMDMSTAPYVSAYANHLPPPPSPPTGS